MRNERKRTSLLVLLWLSAIGVSGLLIDERVASWVYRSGFHRTVKHFYLISAVRAPGNFYFTLIIAAAIVIAYRRISRAAVTLCLSGIIAGLFYTITKWVVGRPRPARAGQFFLSLPPNWDWFSGGLLGLFKSTHNLSFPSGHVCVAFASAAALQMALGWWWPFLVAVAVAAERVLEGAHYVSDVIAAAGIGILAAFAADRLISWVERKGSVQRRFPSH